jgi:hypothetical protein
MSIYNLTQNDIRKAVDVHFYHHQDLIYPLNEYTAYLISKKDSSIIKQFISNRPSTSLTIQDYRNLINSLSYQDLADARQTILDLTSAFSDLHYVYFGSRSALRSVFHTFFPSSFDIMFNYLTSQHIKQIGPGLGQCFLLYPSFFQSDFSDFTYKTFDSQDALSKLLIDFKSLKADNDYLVSLVETKDQQIQELLDVIQNLEHQNFLNSQMTWR